MWCYYWRAHRYVDFSRVNNFKPSKAVGGSNASESPGLQSNKGSDDKSQRTKPRGGDMEGDVNVANQNKLDMAATVR